MAINLKTWGANNRHHEKFRDLAFVRSLIGKKCRFVDFCKDPYVGKVEELYWEGQYDEHCFDIREEGGLLNSLAIWKIEDFYVEE